MKNGWCCFLMVFVLMFSCKKGNDTESGIENFVRTSNVKTSVYGNSSVQLVKTEQLGPKEVSMTFQTSVSPESMEISTIKLSVLDLVAKIIAGKKENRMLLNQGVNFRIVLTDLKGKKIASEIVNKTSMTSNARDFVSDKKQDALNQMLEVLNSKLPITDSATGVKIIRISLGDHSNVVYTAEVPENLEKAVQGDKAKETIKTNMSKDKSFKKMLSELKKFDVYSIRYEYRKKGGKLLQQVEMKENDFR